MMDVFLSIRKINLHALWLGALCLKEGFVKTADISLFLFSDIPASPLTVIFFLPVFFISVYVF